MTEKTKKELAMLPPTSCAITASKPCGGDPGSTNLSEKRAFSVHRTPNLDYTLLFLTHSCSSGKQINSSGQ